MHKKALIAIVGFIAILTMNGYAAIPVQEGAAVKPNLVLPSEAYAPAELKGIKIDPNNPWKFEFIIDCGQDKKTNEKEVGRFVEYFLAALATPESDIWVNLAPGENNQIISGGLSRTALGKDLLEQDYRLKQLASSLTYPENELGRRYWQSVYQKISTAKGTAHVPINTFNKVWIMPDQAQVEENGNTAVITAARLKVLLEDDLPASLRAAIATHDDPATRRASAAAMRELILPEIEKDVNQGKNFTALRQMYKTFILAAWFKQRLEDSIYKYYINQHKTGPIDKVDAGVKEQIYGQYLKNFKEGAYNYIRKDFDQRTHRFSRRNYYSGGVTAEGTSTSTHFATRLLHAVWSWPAKRTKIVPIIFHPEGNAPETAAAPPVRQYEAFDPRVVGALMMDGEYNYGTTTAPSLDRQVLRDRLPNPATVAGGLKLWYAIEQSLPGITAVKLARETHAMGVICGIIPETRMGFDSTTNTLTLAEQEQIVNAINSSGTCVCLPTQYGSRPIWIAINIDATAKVIRDNQDIFGAEALANPRQWLIANSRSWLLNGAQHGLLSGFPRHAMERYPIRSKGLMAIADNRHLFSSAELILLDHELLSGMNHAPFDTARRERLRQILEPKHILSADELQLLLNEFSVSTPFVSFAGFNASDLAWAHEMNRVFDEAQTILLGDAQQARVVEAQEPPGGILFQLRRLHIKTRLGADYPFNAQAVKQLKNSRGLGYKVLKPLEGVDLDQWLRK